MIPAGYLAKHVSSRPEWLGTDRVVDVYSISTHISRDFADYIPYWKHNGHWLFDSPGIIRQVAAEHSINLTGTTLFFYEVYEFEFDADQSAWSSFVPAPFETNVVVPGSKHLEGYDVVTFSVGTSPECSPLSCNRLAQDIETNQHCLLVSLDQAYELLEQGKLKQAEPGPYRIFSVSSVEWLEEI